MFNLFIINFILCMSFLFTDLNAEQVAEPVLILNMENDPVFPKNFRTTANIPVSPAASSPSLEGLADLKVSASGQFSENGLKELLKHIFSDKVLIIDLRQESHGLINGIAVSWAGENNWANKNKSLKEVLQDEESRLNLLKHQSLVSMCQIGGSGTIQISVNTICSEAELVSKYNLDYVRLPATDHLKPDDQLVDSFITLIDELPDDIWVHFHCAAGRGRATTFVVMYDMLRNSKTVSFEDIILRHSMLGGKDLLEIPSRDIWKYEFQVERASFLKKFYRFCHERQNNESWTQWLIFSDLFRN